MNRIKCVNCGFVSWATAETCKKCGAQLSESNQVDSPTQSTNAGALIDDPIGSPGRGKRLAIVLAILVLMALFAGLLAFKPSAPDSPKTLVLKDGSKKSSKTWHRTWFSSDPSVEEIVAQYFKVSGWQDNPSALTSFVAKGRFQIKNEPGETLVETPGLIRFEKRLQWESIEGDVEFEGQAPDKIVITQKYDDAKVLLRGTNGKAGWSRKGSPEKSWEVDPRMRLVNTYPLEELRDDRLADLKRGADFINYLHLANKYDQVFVSGKTMVGDRVAYEVTHRTHPDAVQAMYFDVETGMLLKIAAFRPGAAPYIPMFEKYRLPFYESPDLTETYLEDYRDVNGVKLPFLIRQHFRYYWINTTITDFKANGTIDPSVFEKPRI